MTNTFYKLAKQKDSGRYALLGMMHECASYFNVSIESECVLYIVETFLECIDNCSFEEWIRGFNPDEKVVVMDRDYLKENFNDLLSFSDDLDTLRDLFMYLYDQDVWVDYSIDVLYSTVFNLSLKNRIRLNYIGIAMEYERLNTIHSKNGAEWKDIDSFVECLNQYGYDIESDYDYRTEDINTTIQNINERMQQVFFL